MTSSNSAGTYTLPEPVGVSFDNGMMSVGLDDGRTITVPLGWYPRLLNATPQERADCWLSPGGVHWDGLDEDISVEGLMGARAVRTDDRRAA